MRLLIELCCSVACLSMVLLLRSSTLEEDDGICLSCAACPFRTKWRPDLVVCGLDLNLLLCPDIYHIPLYILAQLRRWVSFLIEYKIYLENSSFLNSF